MDQYKINKEDLEDLVKKVYEEACYGYLDLKESVCEKMISEFLADKSKHQTQLEQNATFTYTPTVWTSASTTGNTYVSMISSPTTTNEHLVLAGLRPASEGGAMPPPIPQTGIRLSSSGNTFTFTDHATLGVSDDYELRSDTQLRADNFVGNESERN